MSNAPLLDMVALERRLGRGPGAFLLQVPELRLDPGQLLAVVGPSGSGKSTLLAILALALRPDGAERFVLRAAGEVHDVAGIWQRDDQGALSRLRARALGFVPQTAGLLPFLTLRANIALSQEIAGRPDPGHVVALAERLGIAGTLDRRPDEVSVGQRLRAAVARALAHRPALVLADEPTAAVHPAQADELLQLLAEVADGGAAVLVATHDIARAAAAGYLLMHCVPDAGQANVTRVGAAA